MNELFEYIKDCRDIIVPNNDLNNLLENTVSRDAVSKYLNEILSNKELFQNIVSSSYIHQLGFEKYVLLKSRGINQLSIRMHVWNEKRQSVYDKDIHDHLHNFTSKVILGTLDHKFYKIDKSGNEYSFYKYEINNLTNISKQEYIGKVSVNLTSNLKVNTDSIYSLKADKLHQVKANEPFVVSILVRGMKTKSFARVLKNNNITKKQIESIGISKLSSEEVEIRFKDLINKFKN